MTAHPVKIGWFVAVSEGAVVYPAPTRFHLDKDPSPSKRGWQSCPAVRNVTRGVFVVTSPFSLHLRFRRLNDAISFTPVYPATSLSEERLSQMFRLEPRDSWRSDDTPVIQFPSPYVFVSDERVEVEQLMPAYGHVSSLNWRLISGRFDIYGWQRPLNWAFEWDVSCGDLVIRMGDPLYWVKFYDTCGAVIESPNLTPIRPSEELQERMSSFSGVTGTQRGTAKLIRESSKTRLTKFLE